MKKGLLALACALVMGQSAFAQQETQYVDDCSQGVLLNKFKDNWFITVEGGANVYFSPNDSYRSFANRWEPQADLFIGKWFSPTFGLRIGAEWLKIKNLVEVPGAMGVVDNTTVNGMYKQRLVNVGPQFDILISLSNIIGGYSRGRIYNGILYGGGGGYWTLARRVDANGKVTKYEDAGDKIINLRVGLINDFRITSRFHVGVDVRLLVITAHPDQAGYDWNRTAFDLSGSLMLSYDLGKNYWECPKVPVCAPAEDCDPYRSLLSDAEARIADLEAQLAASLARPVEVITQTVEVEEAPLATIYFPIGVSKLTPEDQRIIDACAEMMKNNAGTKYVVTGWADNYTGTEAINQRLREERAAAVEKQLLSAGVPASQFSTTINSGTLSDLGEKFVALDRAATITIAE